MTPTQLRYIYNINSGDDKPAAYKTWTQIAMGSGWDWPPGTTAVFMMWNDTIIVGANYDEETRIPLYEWRKKWSLNKIAPQMANRDPTGGITAQNPTYIAWQDMYYKQGMKQSDIARALKISPAHCSNMKRKYEQEQNEVDTV